MKDVKLFYLTWTTFFYEIGAVPGWRADRRSDA